MVRLNGGCGGKGMLRGGCVCVCVCVSLWMAIVERLFEAWEFQMGVCVGVGDLTFEAWQLNQWEKCKWCEVG